jgi:hypothetical protein
LVSAVLELLLMLCPFHPKYQRFLRYNSWKKKKRQIDRSHMKDLEQV